VNTSTLDAPPIERLFSVDTLADYLGVSPKTLYDWRLKRTGPPAIKVGSQLRWRPSAVEAWLDVQGQR